MEDSISWPNMKSPRSDIYKSLYLRDLFVIMNDACVLRFCQKMPYTCQNTAHIGHSKLKYLSLFSFCLPNVIDYKKSQPEG